MARRAKGKTVEFKLYAPQAKKVSVAGSFNSWDVKDLLAKKDTKGNWTVQASLRPGRHEYKFFVDGNWVNDPSCKSCIPNSFGTQNCILETR